MQAEALKAYEEIMGGLKAKAAIERYDRLGEPSESEPDEEATEKVDGPTNEAPQEAASEEQLEPQP